ncbi:RNA polymerase factor sigma-54, partial [Ruminococcaceae bacterium OttesenSCG-928-D13]|nr:RNA polymerase factor sigma-54 [Ruminococcaceae bacterium OttesenSCG-928-D13]
MLKTTTDTDAAAWLRKKQSEATGLIHSVEEREKTLLRVLREVVDAQPEYFSSGTGLKPMTMSALADKLGLHLSTISRAVQGKYIVCTAGTVELKSLFSVPVGGGDNAVSASLVRERIKKLVDAEDPAHPLTDQNICDALKSMNIIVSRRVIVKYREALGIPSSSGRRAR